VVPEGDAFRSGRALPSSISFGKEPILPL